jgi:tetratricopeptide (TPR) repeat protein
MAMPSSVNAKNRSVYAMMRRNPLSISRSSLMKNHLALFFVGFVTASFLQGQDLRPATVAVAPKNLVVYFSGRAQAQITQGWPATVLARFGPDYRPGSLVMTLQDSQRHALKWPWKEAVDIKMTTGVLKYWTLAPADTTALPAGSYTLAVEGRVGRKQVRSVLAFEVSEVSSQTNTLEQARNELAYFRAIGDRASAVTAAERASKLAPDDPASQLDYGRALLEAGQAQEALKITQTMLSKLPPNKNEPPAAFLQLENDAQTQLLDKVAAGEKPGT